MAKRSKAPKKPGTCVKVRMGASGMRWLCRRCDGKVQIAPSGKGTKCSSSKRKKSKR